MAKLEQLEFGGSMTITPISPTNKTHLVVNLDGMSLVFHVESWDSYLHLEAIKKFDQMLNELRVAQQTLKELQECENPFDVLRTAHSTPTSSCS